MQGLKWRTRWAGASRLRRCGWAALCLALVGGGGFVAAADPSRESVVSFRRLTQDQYRQSVADVFGDDIKVSGRLQPDPRREGLVAIGVSQSSVSASGFEQYDATAREVAGQVTDEAHRDLLGCKPVDAKRPDDACARTFLGNAGRLLYRRPLQPAELDRFVGLARQGAIAKNDFYEGVSTSLGTMLVSPSFLFRTERAIWSNGRYRLDDYSVASRISFLIWNGPPDAALLAAAERGELGTSEGLRSQVDRMLASPRFESGVRAFFTDMLALEDLDSLQKDPTIYPRFNSKLASDVREQTLRTIVDVVVRRDEGYRELFVTRRTFLSRSIGVLYGMPVTSRSWEAYEFPAEDPRSGILAQPAFLMAHSHPGRSSPTLRGKAIRELVLCQQVPAPPPNVDFAIVQNVKDPKFATARQRIAAHNTQPMCVGCHKLTDPLGLPLEGFDGGAGMRTTENGAVIDLSGDHNGKRFVGAQGLGWALASDPALASCLVTRVFGYGAGRAPGADDAAWLDAVRADADKGGLKFREVVRRIALSDEFYRPELGESATKVAAATSGPARNAKETPHGS
jgi:hypothetical protein